MIFSSDESDYGSLPGYDMNRFKHLSHAKFNDLGKRRLYALTQHCARPVVTPSSVVEPPEETLRDVEM